ncbi:hypothetical protein ACFW31_23340 [Nocardiopsis alba]|uniref:hypothetical protein n=1 Tax=Nocardiopsis alba TaxID=53437 RepID=UPI00366B1674
MSRHPGRGPAFSIIALSIVLALAGCSSAEPEPPPDTEYASELVSVFWVERQVRVVTLDRMIDEVGSDEVLVNMGGARELLFDQGIIVPEGGGEADVDWEAGYQDGDLDGYVVELDEDAWDTTIDFSRIDGALNDAMYHNEVTWCGDDVTGEEFVDAYMDVFQGAFDTHDAYEASVADHVDCGDGRI